MKLSATMASWDSIVRKAKNLESKLESAISSYAQIAQRIESSYGDAENPSTSSREESNLASEIERDLSELSDCVANMRNTTPTIPMHQYESIVKRYYEIHFDHMSEFNNISAKISRARNAANLFGSASNRGDGRDSAMERLLGESSGIKSSLKSTNEVIGQAFEIRNSLSRQRETMANSASGLTSITANIPMLDRLIDGIQKKKAKESAILAAVVGGLVCITIWWVFFR